MTRKYLFIEESGAEVCATSRFFIVRCSQQGAQNLRDYLYLVAYATDHGHYFSLWSQDVAKFVQKISGSLGFDVSERFQMIRARDLVRALRASLNIPLDSNVLLNHDRMRKYLDLNYRVLARLRENPPACGNTSKT